MKTKIAFGLFFLMLSCSAIAQTEIKFNALTATILIPNVGVEIQISDKSSVQLDVLGSFWDSFDGSPLHIVQVFPEYRRYFKPNMRGFFIGGHIGFGMFTLTKYDYPENIFQSGRNTYYGITLGYKTDLGKNWAIEFFLGGGSQQASYQAYDRYTGKRVDIDIEAGDEYRAFNKSGELIPYRGGVMLIYRIPFRKNK